jgi:2-polyprenyl-3-methyl-5-hydroxy-6-metoxy-1,4-benzoquinol methylase
MPIRDNQFDIVFNADVIEHFNKEDRTKALKEYSRILKDNGVMFIAFPNHYSVPYRIAYIIRKILKRWIYPDEYKMYDLIDKIKSANLILKCRVILSKKSVMTWLDFMPPLKWFFQFIDIFYKFEGYLTVLEIKKKT